MERNTVVLSLEEYNLLRDIRDAYNEISKNNGVVEETSYFGVSIKIISKDEKVKQLYEKIHKLEEDSRTKSFKHEKEKELLRKKLDKVNSNIDKKLSKSYMNGANSMGITFKKMSIWDFITWRWRCRNTNDDNYKL